MLEIVCEQIVLEELREGDDLFGGKVEVINPFYGQSTYVVCIRGPQGGLKTVRIPESTFKTNAEGKTVATAILQDGNGKRYGDYDTDVRDKMNLYTQQELRQANQSNQSGGQTSRARSF